MAEQVRVAVAGLVHDHIWGILDHLRQDGRASLVAAVDDNEPLLRRARERYGVERTYGSLDELLAGPGVDAVVCGTENSRHAPVVEAAAARGLHVLVEKPMAATYDQARRMLAAAEQADIILMVNWPTAWSRSIGLADELVKDGRIGQPFYLKYHAGHEGPREFGCSEYFWRWLYDPEKNGPGALMDYCCYGANLACHFLGPPQSVTGAGGRFVKAEEVPMDNAILLMQYERAVAVAEASWSQIGHPPHYELVVMGSGGSIVAPTGGDHVILVTPDRSSGHRVDAPSLPAGRDNEAAYFLSCVLEGTQPSGQVSPRVSLQGQEVLEAGFRAVETRCAVDLPLGRKS